MFYHCGLSGEEITVSFPLDDIAEAVWTTRTPLALHTLEWRLNASLKWALPHPALCRTAGHPVGTLPQPHFTPTPNQPSITCDIILYIFCICLKIHRLVRAWRYGYVTCYIWRGIYQTMKKVRENEITNCFRRLAHRRKCIFDREINKPRNFILKR